jgi:hypothetical protein
MNNKEIKSEIAELLLNIETDPMLFIDLFVEQYLSRVFTEVDARSWWSRATDLLTKNKGQRAAARYDFNPKLQEIMSMLTALESEIQNAPSGYADTGQAQTVFNFLKKLVKNLTNTEPVLKDTLSKMRMSAINKANWGGKATYQTLRSQDIRTKFGNIISLKQLNTILVNDPFKSCTDMFCRQLLVAAESIDPASYTQAAQDRDEIKKYDSNSFQELDKNALRLANNDRNFADKIILYLISITGISETLQQVHDDSVYNSLPNIKNVKDLVQYWDDLHGKQKNNMIEEIKKQYNNADPKIQAAYSFYTKVQNYKIGQNLKKFIDDIQIQTGITQTDADQVVLTLLSKTGIESNIMGGRTSGSNPMDNIVSIDDIKKYFDSLNDTQKEEIESRAQTANLSTPPMSEGKKVLDGILQLYPQGIRNSYRSIYAFVNNDKKRTENILYFIIGQANKLIAKWTELKTDYIMYITVMNNMKNKSKVDVEQVKMEWDWDLWKDIQKVATKDPTNSNLVMPPSQLVKMIYDYKQKNP